MYRIEIIYYTVYMDEVRLQEIHDKARKEHVPIMLDDGTAVGYSAIQMANLRWDMTIDTVEINPEMYHQAVDNIMHAGLQDRVHAYLQDAYQFETKKIYDLIFIDAAKSQYRKYMEHFFKNARKGTVFFFDNLQFHGIVDCPELSQNRSTVQMTRKILKFREYLKTDTRFETTFHLDVGDGIAIAVVK